LLIGLYFSKTLQLERVRPYGKPGFTGTKVVVNGQDSIVGVVANYGLDNPGFETHGGKKPILVQTGPEAHPASCTMGTKSLSWGNKWAGAWQRPPTPSSARVEIG